jgi:long-chain acyl-CoA synthetase
VTLARLLFGDDVGDATEVVVHAGERSVDRRGLRIAASELRVALVAAGVRPGAAVGVMLSSGPEAVAALFGVWAAGAVHVPLNPRLGADDLDRVVAYTEPAVVVTSPDRAERVPSTVGFVTAEEPFRWHVDRPVIGGREYDPGTALVQLTSGTTGAPKPVQLRHDGVLDLMDNVITRLRGGDADASRRRAATPNLVPVSLSLWAGIYTVCFAFRVGAPVVLMDRFEAHEFVRLVRKFDVRSVVLPPAAMAMLSDTDDVTDLAPLRFVRSITAPLSPIQARRFAEKFGVAVLNGYGQTEIGGEVVGWSAADSREFGDTKLGSVGRPHAGVEVAVRDERGRELDTDGVGELWLRTPALAAGYADGTDLADRLDDDGFFRTGDVGRVDADGFVWIEGRVGAMINRGGLKVFPAEVEEAIRLHPLVRDVAVVGVADDRLGDVPWAFVVVDASIEPDELSDLCRRHLAPYKLPVRFVTVDALPRNEVGKVLSGELMRLADPGRGQAPRPTMRLGG